MMRAAILQVEKDNNVSLNDEDIIGIIEKQVKQRKDSVAEFKKGGREDLVAQTEAELSYLYKFLPEQLSADELKKIVAEAIEALGLTDIKQMGKLMAEVMPKVKGRADGKAINEAAKELLSK